jgi:Lar family restriction alleviation protein
MKEIDLKRCPFCGGYAHLDDPSEMGDYGVSCEKCGLFVIFGRDGECQTREEAAEAWNRRADDGRE